MTATPTGPMTLEVIERTRESKNVVSLRLKVVDGEFVPFVAGQHLPLRFNLPERPISTYTISSDAADHASYRISVKLEPSGKGGSQFVHNEAQIGTRIVAEHPRGKFTLAPDNRPVVLLTGGIGVTPALAMLSELARQPDRPTYFIHSCMRADEHSFAGELAEISQRAANVTYHVAYAEGEQADLDAGRCQSLGMIDRKLLRQLLPLDAYHVYLCGPDGFMTAMRTALVSLGVPDVAIQQESFGGAAGAPTSVSPTLPLKTQDTGDAPLVRFAKSGIEARWDGSDSLLEFAESQGLAPEFECRDGICGSCACAKLNGEVVYTEEPIDSPAEGQVLICCSVPEGAVVLDL